VSRWPIAEVCFDGTFIGTTTDARGHFFLQNSKGCHRLAVSVLTYKTRKFDVRRGQKTVNMVCRLAPADYALAEVVVKLKREKYHRRDNPAVELIKKVISHKSNNRIESGSGYGAEIYEKLALSLGDFQPNYSKGFYSKFKFLANYTDTSAFDGKPILTLSVRESLSDHYFRRSPRADKTIVKAQRMQGIDDAMDNEGTITANLDEIFKPVNVFDNDIPILLNRFVSPLSTTLAVQYYRYYIQDTVDVAGEPCTDLAFVPVNPQSYGFDGHLYITQDGRYAVKKVTLTTPSNINLNWVERFRIDEQYTRMPDGTWAPSTENSYVNFCVIKGTQKFYAHKLRSYSKYRSDPQNADSVFALPGSTRTMPMAALRPDSWWQSHRHVPLQAKESAIDGLLARCRALPLFNVLLRTAEILISGYIPTGSDATSKFDFGPMYSSLTSNRIEGLRLRFGGMTTANLCPYWFATGYVAYGTSDRKWKYSLRLTHSFNKKLYHEGESPLNNLSYLREYDLYTLGQDFVATNKDNMFLAIKVGAPQTNVQYIRKGMLQYQKEWLTGLTWTSWASKERNTSAGTLKYATVDAAGATTVRSGFDITEVGTQLRFAPGERPYNSRRGKESMVNLSKDAPVFKLSHAMGLKGVMGGDFSYNHTELSVQKRIWLSSFGRFDAQLKVGKVWDKVPFPLLIIPNANQSITIQPESFHLMNAMEFVADQYASFNATYYLKGFIMNRLPLIKWLHLREVMSFNMICGSLSDKNNPGLTPGLFRFPDGTRPLGRVPYMECSFGVDNLFNILRVDYYRRLTYLHEPHVSRNGFRVALHFAF
jgi:hypothetical protein